MNSRILVISLLLTGPAVLAVALIGLALQDPTAVDSWWHDLMAAFRAAPLDAVALFLDRFGAHALGFGLVPALLAVCLLLARRRRAVIGLLAVGLVSYGVVQLLKQLIDRARPEDMLTLSDAGSYPSGHVTNVATLLVFVALVFARPWIWSLAAGYIVLMAWSRTYLHAHWLSDTLAGIVLGGALACLAFSVVELSRSPGRGGWRGASQPTSVRIEPVVRIERRRNDSSLTSPPPRRR